MKKLFFAFALFFLLSNCSIAQVSLRLVNYRPTGEFGFVMKPAWSVEVGWQPRFSKRTTKRMRTGFSLLYLNMKPRMEVFPVSGVLHDGNGTTVLPGSQAFQRYRVFQLAGGFDYAVVHRQKLNLYAGFDIIAGVVSVDYTHDIPGWKNESYQGGGIMGGGRVRLGAEYSLSDRISIFLNASRSTFLLSEPTSISSANDYGLGVRYSFN